ncbi:MAG: DUF2207 domain-containing protein, partial [Bacteroidales bacterium]|nr:DUF2207 domain-containing protein [Bacteroidales bacterium]
MLAILVSSFAVCGARESIRNIEIDLILRKDGSAEITEKWDVSIYGGITEWYLVRNNLGDIEVKDLAVTDENGLPFSNIGEWGIDRSISQKAGKCGYVHKRNGVELCWGIGSYGDHVFTVSYTMTNAVKTLNDYDILHMQLVSPGLSASPSHVRVSIAAEDISIDTSNTLAWGFGFYGTTAFSEGKVVYESNADFNRDCSVIALLRFNKGIFRSPSIKAMDFQTIYDEAMEGADFGDDEDENAGGIILAMLLAFGGILGGALLINRAHTKKILGVKRVKDVDWSRDIPYEGSLFASNYIIKELGLDKKGNSLAAALILKMIYNGQLEVRKDAKDKVEIAFSDKNLDTL